MEDEQYFTNWGEVPGHLRTKTQLADLDLPRVPGTEPVARVRDRGPQGPKRTYELYDVAASLPSPASAKQLEAARARQATDTRRCAHCGAHTDTTPSQHHDDAADAWIGLCWTCLHIARLRRYQAQLADDRARHAATAARLLAEDTAAVVHVTPIAPPPGENGRPKKPIAALLEAVTPAGNVLIQASIRLNGSRNPIVPSGALLLADAEPMIRETLAGRAVVLWAVGAARPLDELVLPRGYDRRSEVVVLDRVVAEWRGEIDPHARRLITPLDPGRADRMALLIRRIAADHHPENGDPE